MTIQKNVITTSSVLEKYTFFVYSQEERTCSKGRFPSHSKEAASPQAFIETSRSLLPPIKIKNMYSWLSRSSVSVVTDQKHRRHKTASNGEKVKGRNSKCRSKSITEWLQQKNDLKRANQSQHHKNIDPVKMFCEEEWSEIAL